MSDGASSPRSFACDAMLGGLARWLRAAGYDACWQPGIDDHALIHQAQEQERTLLSCDTKIFLFRLIRDGVLPALLVPLHEQPESQLAHVLSHFRLPLQPPRCMACGGDLIETPKDTVRDLVPPRTFAWLDAFWRCARCGQVFWRGTHWQRIAARLEEAAARDPLSQARGTTSNADRPIL